MNKFLLLFLLAPCHLASFALNVPAGTSLTVEPTLSNVVPNAEAHCAQQGPSTSHLPLSPDCIKAVRLLPHSDYVGTFHIGGDTSLWRLPKSQSSESCKVIVTLHEDFDLEMGTWVDVCAAAIILLRACRLPFEPGGEQRTGGWITSGEENGLVIQLVRSGDVGGHETGEMTWRNSTAVSVE